MRKVLVYCAPLLLVALIVPSCKTVQTAKFTSVENLYRLKLGTTLDSVITQLGSPPYNILSSQIDGYTIYSYRYKCIEREVSPDLVNKKGGETLGTEVYNKREQTAFLFFKDGKLESFITSEGKRDGAILVTLNNTLYVIARTKERDKYVITPVPTDKQGNFALPFKRRTEK